MRCFCSIVNGCRVVTITYTTKFFYDFSGRRRLQTDFDERLRLDQEMEVDPEEDEREDETELECKCCVTCGDPHFKKWNREFYDFHGTL